MYLVYIVARISLKVLGMLPLNVKTPLREPFVKSFSAFSKVLSSVAVK